MVQSRNVMNQYIEQTGMICVNKSFERPDWDEYFMLQAELAKLRSNCMTSTRSILEMVANALNMAFEILS